jgi:syndecan 4
VCTACVPGTYSAAGASACISCLPGSYAATSGLASCQPCTAGKYLALPGQTSDCLSCVAGTYSAAGASVCTTCAAGKSSTQIGQNGPGNCTNCLAGKYSTAGASVCTDCPAGKYSGATGLTVCTDCVADRYAYPGALTCDFCVAGKEKAPLTGGVNAIDMCPPVPSAFWQRDALIFGQVFKSSWYSTDKRANGLWTIYSLKISESAVLPAGVPGGSGIRWVAYVVDKVDYPWQITAPWNCWDKTELSWKNYPQMRFSTDICGDCAAGKYKEMPGNYSCIACPPNSYSPTKSSAVCDCNPGYTGSGSLNCTACEAGKYKDTQGSSLCTACPDPVNSFSTAGSVNITDCKCNPGHTGADGGNCTACPQSTYKPLQGSGACTECSTTHPNTAHALTGQVNSTSCVCDAGYTLTLGVCESCPERTYKILIDNSLCLPCSDHSTSEPASNNPSACVCNAGYAPMRAQTSATPVLCSACTAGKFKNATSRAPSSATSDQYIESEKCKDCDAGLYAVIPV